MKTSTTLCLALAFPGMLIAQSARRHGHPNTAVTGRGGGYQYCVPPYSTGPSEGDFIDGVTLGDISNLNSGGDTSFTPAAYNGTGSVTRLVPGTAYDLGITSGSYDPLDGYFEGFAAWIDYDQDGQFNNIERIGVLQTTDPEQTGTISFTVPDWARPGYTVMRVRNAYNYGAATIDPCSEVAYGETEDYIVLIDDGFPCIPLYTTGTAEGDFISGLTLNDLNDGSGPSIAPYSNRLNRGTQLMHGSENTVSVVSGEYEFDVYGVWIDWNQDGDWDDADELIGIQASSTAFEPLTFTFTVPDSIFGYCRMRVRAVYDNLDMTACNDEQYGETRDYTIAVQNPDLWPCQPVCGTIDDGDQIASVSFQGQTYNQAAHSWPHYTYWADPPIHLGQGSSQTMTITSGTYDQNRFQLYLDMNNDNDFDDPGEDLGYVDNTASSEVMPLNFTVPSTCMPGQHFMRLRVFHNFSDDPIAPCVNTYYGEIQDYVVVVEDPDGPCIPYLSNWTTDGDYIDGVELGSISNTGTGGNYGSAYNDYSAQSTDLAVNSTHTLNITSGEYDEDHFAAWIDYNADGDWDDAGELLGEVVNTASGQTLQINFTVPGGTTLGAKRLRVRCYYGIGLSACDDSGYGETEDYSVEITDATAIAQEDGARFAVLPDPGRHVVQVCGNVSAQAQITLLDATGRVLLHRQATGARTTINMEGFANGAYLIRWDGKGERRTQRFSWVVQ